VSTGERYPQEFFESNRVGARRSAQAVVPLIIEILKPTSVVDVGCGLGTWLAAFRQNGVTELLGIDGDYVDVRSLEIEPEEFLAHDLSRPLAIDRSFDLTISLEVAEHLDPDHAAEFVALLTSLAPAIVFSAAIPHQDGTHHVNTQWPTYWRALFAAQDFELIDCIRPQIWENEAVDFWYRQNMVVFARTGVAEGSPTLRAERRVRKPLDVVHPTHWSQVMHQAALDRDALTAAQAALAAPPPPLPGRILGRLRRDVRRASWLVRKCVGRG
jgi:SAM-dependent methyltransferase